jgi:hypothetical protein
LLRGFAGTDGAKVQPIFELTKYFLCGFQKPVALFESFQGAVRLCADEITAAMTETGTYRTFSAAGHSFLCSGLFYYLSSVKKLFSSSRAWKTRVFHVILQLKNKSKFDINN